MERFDDLENLGDLNQNSHSDLLEVQSETKPVQIDRLTDHLTQKEAFSLQRTPERSPDTTINTQNSLMMADQNQTMTITLSSPQS
jgi:hypothetical protein